MEELTNSFDFWVTIIKALMSIIILIGGWNIFLTLKMFSLQQSLALNAQSDDGRIKAIEKLQTGIDALTQVVSDLGAEVKIMNAAIESLQNKKK